MSNKKKVVLTKATTIQQCINMSINLRHKFNTSACVNIAFWYMDHLDMHHIEYRLYIENHSNDTYKSWSELQDRYFDLMNRRLK